MKTITYRELSYNLMGLCFEIHNNLGPGFTEVVYKDALELELNHAGILFEREKMYLVNYKGYVLPHKFHADFVVEETIILEIKATSEITNIHCMQIMNYLKVSKNRLGIIINFGEEKLNYKRIVL